MLKRTLSIILALAMVTALVLPVMAETYAPPATVKEIEADRKLMVGGDGTIEIINGEVYGYGPNNANCLGLAGFQAADGHTIALNERVLSPVKIPPETFDGAVVEINLKRFQASALTDKGSVYIWGGPSLKPTKAYDPEEHGGVKITKLSSGYNDRAWYCMDENGKWYGADYNYVDNIPTQYPEGSRTPSNTPKMVPFTDEFMAAINNEEIVNVVGTYTVVNGGNSTGALLTKQGHIWTWGSQYEGQLGNGKKEKDIIWEPYLINQGELAGVKFTMLDSNHNAFVAVDDKNSSYAWGMNHSYTNNPDTYIAITGTGDRDNVAVPTKNYTAPAGVNIVRLIAGGPLTILLMSDNTLVGWGSPHGAFPGIADDIVETPVQIAAEASKKGTIVNVVPINGSSVTIRYKNGDKEFSGNNSTGNAGNGTTVTPPPGESTEVVQPDLPPLKPVSSNKITVEIADKSGEKVTAGADGTLPIKAGDVMTANVYFDDFARLSYFTVPIGFDPNIIQILDANDKEYARTTTNQGIVIDQKATSGITSGITDSVWLGGSLTYNSYYPKINNQYGYISVAGSTTNFNATVEGKQLMFSFKFMAKESGNSSMFLTYKGAAEATGPNHYDPSWDQNIQWGVSKQTFDDLGNDIIKQSSWAFDEKEFPRFTTTVVKTNSFALTLERQSGGKQYAVQKKDGSYIIDWRNTEDKYIVKVVSDPADASFPQVNWSQSLSAGFAEGVVSDYIDIISETPMELQFMVRKDLSGNDKLIDVKADNIYDPVNIASQTAALKITTLEAPEWVKITEKDAFTKNTNPFTAENETYTFTPSFPDGAKNTEVAWALYNQDGDLIDSDDPNAPVIISNVDTTTGGKTCTVTSKRTTPDGEYVMLRVTSAYNSTVTDEVKIEVKLKSTALKFTETEIYLSPNGKKQLTVGVQPYDAYNTDLVWAKGVPAGGTSYISFNAATQIVTADPVGQETLDKDIYDVIEVYDANSDAPKATLKVYVVEINSPVSENEATITNNVGDNNDTLKITDGILVGDTVKIFSSFNDEEPVAEIEVTDDNLSNFVYTFPDGEGKLLKEGGTAAIQIVRDDNENYPGGCSKVPIQYTAEPCKVSGVVRLQGRQMTSKQNEGIHITLWNSTETEKLFETSTSANGKFTIDKFLASTDYVMTLSKQNYLTRKVSFTLVSSEDFIISTSDKPIYLYPGDIDLNGIISGTDVNTFITQWFGAYDSRGGGDNFQSFNFVEAEEADLQPGKINVYDLHALLSRFGMTTNDYMDWSL